MTAKRTARAPQRRKVGVAPGRAGAAADPDRGLFLVLEGVDGAGTTTQAERIAAALRERGLRVRVTRQPSDGPVGTLIRHALTRRFTVPGGEPLSEQTLALLFAADRLDHLQAQVLPAVERGEIVICDRYLMSSLAYQGSALPLGWVQDINAFATPADLTLFLRVDAQTAAARRAARGGDPELFEADERQRTIIRQYDEVIAGAQDRERIVELDGGRPVEEVTRRCLAALEPLIARREAG